MNNWVVGFLFFLLFVLGCVIASTIRWASSGPPSKRTQLYASIASRILGAIAIISLLLAHVAADSVMLLRFSILAGMGAFFCLLFSGE